MISIAGTPLRVCNLYKTRSANVVLDLLQGPGAPAARRHRSSLQAIARGESDHWVCDRKARWFGGKVNLRTLISVFLVLTLSSCRLVSAGLEPNGGRVVNVRDFGARGDGVADDTAAIQAAINAAKASERIYFPPGIFNVSNFVVKNRQGLSFVGEGRKSIIKQKTGAARIATVEASRDIAISNLAFDANGIVSYGGVVFYAGKGVRIENNTFFDSASKPIRNTDRYSFVFARGSEPSQDIKIVNNVIDDLQLEVNHSQRVLIDRNTVKRAIATAGIGIFTIGDKTR